MSTVIRAEDLCVTLKIPRRPEKELVRHVNFEVQRGECLGILGESGSGKSMSIKAMLGLLDKNFSVSGHAWFGEKDLLKESGESMRKIRGSEIAVVLQNPMTCFDPLYRIGSQIGETFATHTDWNANEIREKSLETLERMRIRNPEETLQKYPHQLSGGMLQRIMIGIAMALKPALLIADEPTTALDVTIEAQILQLMKKLCEEQGTSIILITHNMGVVAEICDYVYVMYAGKVMEQAETFELFDHTAHPYTKGLLKSIPKLDEQPERLYTIEGVVPNLLHLPKGCRFCTRCECATERCFAEMPELYETAEGHRVRCFLSENEGKREQKAEKLQAEEVTGDDCR